MDAGGSRCEGYHAAEWAFDMHKIRSAVRWVLVRMGETGRVLSTRRATRMIRVWMVESE